MGEPTHRIGAIADTHGLLREQVLSTLAGSERILHAGDVGDPAILSRLESIAPVTVVRGNVDTDPWARAIPDTAVVEVGGVQIYMLHDVGALDLDPAAAGFGVVLFGHSHRPLVERRGGVLFVNPGSAGPRRFDLPASVAWIEVSGGRARAEIRSLEP